MQIKQVVVMNGSLQLHTNTILAGIMKKRGKSVERYSNSNSRCQLSEQTRAKQLFTNTGDVQVTSTVS